MNSIEITDLCKEYPKFKLDNVSFKLEQGKIMGFIGCNGAGKSTTMKSMLNIVHRSSGKVILNGYDLDTQEQQLKESIGFVNGGITYFPLCKVKALAKVTAKFYKNWDQEKYQKLISNFEIDENKKINQLSNGMKVKFQIALALSHDAKLLILDEPTTGLDPAARDEIICLFQEYVEDGEHSILFSTHITSDLENCAQLITYIQNGKIIYSTDINSFRENYLCVSGSYEKICSDYEKKSSIIGLHKVNDTFEGLIEKSQQEKFFDFTLTKPTLDEILIHLERKHTL